ncbi:GEVED domain-containing protein [Nonomuraea sp. NPDC004354]
MRVILAGMTAAFVGVTGIVPFAYASGRPASFTNSSTEAVGDTPSGVMVTVRKVMVNGSQVGSAEVSRADPAAPPDEYLMPVNAKAEAGIVDRYENFTVEANEWSDVAELTFTFSRPVRDPRLHVFGTGGRAEDLSGRRDDYWAGVELVSGTPTMPSFSRVAGFPGYEVTGTSIVPERVYRVHSTTCGVVYTCGTVQVNGTVTSFTIRLRARNVRTRGDAGTPHLWGAFKLSLHEDDSDAPSSYGPASHAITDIFIGENATADNADTLSFEARAIRGDADTDDALSGDELVLEDDATAYSLTVPIRSASDAVLAGWIDFDRDGRFDDEERALAEVDRRDDSETLTWNLPESMQAGSTWMRLRVTARPEGVERPTGWADSGEVEDYRFDLPQRVAITPQADTPAGTTPTITTVAAPAVVPPTATPAPVTPAAVNPPKAVPPKMIRPKLGMPKVTWRTVSPDKRQWPSIHSRKDGSRAERREHATRGARRAWAEGDRATRNRRAGDAEPGRARQAHAPELRRAWGAHDPAPERARRERAGTDRAGRGRATDTKKPWATAAAEREMRAAIREVRRQAAAQARRQRAGQQSGQSSQQSGQQSGQQAESGQQSGQQADTGQQSGTGQQAEDRYQQAESGQRAAAWSERTASEAVHGRAADRRTRAEANDDLLDITRDWNDRFGATGDDDARPGLVSGRNSRPTSDRNDQPTVGRNDQATVGGHDQPTVGKNAQAAVGGHDQPNARREQDDRTKTRRERQRERDDARRALEQFRRQLGESRRRETPWKPAQIRELAKEELRRHVAIGRLPEF